MIVPLSGNAGSLGEFSKDGVELAVDEQNAKGGILGKKIVLDIQDSKADPKEGLNILKNMLSSQSKPFAIHTIISGVTLALKPETEKNKTILIAGVATDRFLEGKPKYCIRNYIDANTIGDYLSNYLKDSTQIRKISIFHSNNEYGKSIKDATIKDCVDRGISIGFAEEFDEKSLNYKSLISSKLTKDVNCIYVIAVGKGLANMIKQIRESGYKGQIIGDVTIGFPDVRNAAGEAIKGIKYMDFAHRIETDAPSNKKFNDSFRKKFSKNPDSFSVIGYEGMQILFSTIQKVGNFESDKVMAEMNNVSNYDGVFGKSFIENNSIKYTFTIKNSN